MNDDSVFRPIASFGSLFVIIGTLGIIVLFSSLLDVEYRYIVWPFITGTSLFHVILGFGLVHKIRWAFPLFKGYLRLLYLGYPLGTYLSKTTLRYVEKHQIENYFR